VGETARARTAKINGARVPEVLSKSQPRVSTNPRKELVREQLIDIAAQLFDRKGYAQTNINDIATELGLGRSAIYHYFRNKEEILAAMVEAEALTPSHQLQILMEQPGLSASERIRRGVVDGIIRRLATGSRSILLSRLETQIPEELGPLYNQGRRHIYDFYVRCITEGIANGEFRELDPKIAAFAVIGMANWTSRWYSPKGSKSPKEIGEMMADFALQGLRAEGDNAIDRNAARGTIVSLRQRIDDLERILL
jgi:AcrR family transcriptional regulator